MSRSIRRHYPLHAAALIASLMLPLAAHAADTDHVVSATGSSTVEKSAESLRLQVQIQVEAPTLKDALEKMKARRDQVSAGLAKLGADEKSIDAKQINVSDGSGGDDRQAAMQRALRSRMAGRGGAAAPAAPSVTVACAIKADWTLKAGDTAENLILAASDIKDKIKASKLFEAPKSAAASEADEEASMMASENGPPPTDPNFIFVAKITDAEQAKAMTEAFAKAKDSAARLAKAAGTDLGPIHSLQGQTTADQDEIMALQQYGGNSYYRQMIAQRYAANADAKEAFSMQPGHVTMQVVVEAAFSLK